MSITELPLLGEITNYHQKGSNGQGRRVLLADGPLYVC